MGEQQKIILDYEYSKFGIKEIFLKLDIFPACKKNLYQTPNKFLTLLGGSMGKVDCKPIHIDLKQGSKTNKQRYYNVLKEYEGFTKREVK